MNEVTRILSAIEQGDPHAAEQLLPSPTERKSVKTRYADRAMELLRQAVAKGYRNPDTIKNDHDLDSLRVRKDFQELLADLEAKTKE